MGAPPGGPEDKKAPEIISTIPIADSVNVDVNTTITIEFDESVRTNTLAKAFTFSPLPLGNVRANWKGRTLVLEFAEPLVDDKTYVLTLGTDLSDLRGNSFEDAFLLAFSTGDKLDKGYVKGILKTEGSASGWTLIGYYIGSELPSKTSSVSDPDPAKDIPDAMTSSSADGSWDLTNLREGYWRVFGYNDVDNDKLWTPWLEPLAIPAYDIEISEDSSFVPKELFLVASNPVILPMPQRVFSRLKDRFEVKFDRKPERISQGFKLVTPPDTLEEEELEGYNPDDLNASIQSLEYKAADSSTVIVRWDRLLEGDAAWLSIKGSFGTSEVLDTTLSVNLTLSSDVDTFPPVLVLQSPDVDSRLHDYKPEILLTFSEAMDHELHNGIQVLSEKDTLVPEYIWPKPNILKLNMKPYSIDGRFVVRMFGDSLRDVNGNQALDSLITLNYTKLPLDSLGQMSGVVVNSSQEGGVHVIAHSLTQKDLSIETEVDSSLGFAYPGLPQGYWRLEAWKDVSNNKKWYSGRAFPYFPSDPYVISKDTIYVRARWESGSAQIIFP